MNKFSRTELVLGTEAMEKLKSSKVAIFGIGGVGSFVAEAVARCGVGEIALFDADEVSLTNINRQLIATTKTVGRKKVEVMKERIYDINPDCKVSEYQCFYLPENADEYDLSCFDYIVDAVDTVTAKIELIMRAKAFNIPIISSMGTGNKLDPTKLEVTDIYKTSVCPLAKVMRYELKKRGVKKLKVVYSTEIPVKTDLMEDYSEESGNNTPRKRSIPGSVSFVPSAAGLIIAGEVIKDLSFERV